MADDVVIDTNVLMHCGNRICDFHNSSLSTIERVQTTDIKLAVDSSFSIIEAENRSVIGSEYLTHCRHGSPGFAFLLYMFTNEKVVFYKISDASTEKRKLIRMIRNRHDISFVLVTIRSRSKIFISNDFEDFQLEKRKTINREFDIKIVSSNEYIES